MVDWNVEPLNPGRQLTGGEMRGESSVSAASTVIADDYELHRVTIIAVSNREANRCDVVVGMIRWRFASL